MDIVILRALLVATCSLLPHHPLVLINDLSLRSTDFPIEIELGGFALSWATALAQFSTSLPTGV